MKQNDAKFDNRANSLQHEIEIQIEIQIEISSHSSFLFWFLLSEQSITRESTIQLHETKNTIQVHNLIDSQDILYPRALTRVSAGLPD